MSPDMLGARAVFGGRLVGALRGGVSLWYQSDTLPPSLVVIGCASRPPAPLAGLRSPRAQTPPPPRFGAPVPSLDVI